jgi:Ran GTPase-activating protein (RanGAP) involved in mRNA processing and transport
LASNTTLKELDLRGNTRIGDDGAVALAAALASNTTLEKLVLFHNEISYAGMGALAQALKHNDSLEYLGISRDKFGLT